MAIQAHKILVVDDEPIVRSLLADYLCDEGFQCVTAENAFEALNKIKQDEFSLVLSDIRMPGMKGTELLRFIKKEEPEIAVIMITADTDIQTAIDCLRLGAFDYITKPFDLRRVRPAIERALERRQLLIENRFYQRELENKVRERIQELKGAMGEVEDSYRMTLEALVTALDAREHETQAHSQRVREYTLTLARQLGLQGEELIHLGRGALLHDVGKIGVPDSILLKPARLSVEEWEVMERHPQIGHDILLSIRFLAPAAEIVLTHQQRWDGKGYPIRLGGRDIPLGARIFAVVDTLDAITSNRPYRKASSFQAATQEIRRCSGTQFDPVVVEAFCSIPIESWMAIHDSVIRLHDKQQGYDSLVRT